MNIEDSLDNLSALHGSQQRSLLAQVKQKFVTALQKLQSAETREIGISELRRLVEQHREPEHLRNYIAILKALKPSPHSATREHEILVISLLASLFRTQLLDPLDKPPSLLKTVFRLVEVLHGYFADRSATVQQACARALLDLSSHCLAGQDAESVFSIIYSPLLSILKSGVDKGSQATAAACLSELISSSRRLRDHPMLARVAPELLAVVLKVNCEYHELFQAVSSMLEERGLAFLDGRAVAFLAKLLPVLSGARETPPAGSLNSYMCKVHVCKIVERLGEVLPAAEKDKLADLSVQEALVQASRNRIIQVQLAAGRALRAWRGEQALSPPKNGLASLEEKRNSKLKERSRSKDSQEKLEKELTFMKEDLEKLVKGGWGASSRAKNYVKRGSGVGGGSHGKNELSPPSRGSGKSHKEHFEELREYIKKGAEENKHLDRFSLPAAKPRGRSPPKAKPERPPEVEAEEPQLEVDEGDQMVYERPKKRGAEVGSGGRMLEEAGISEEEARELVSHEKTLMDEEKGMNINYYTEKSQPKQSRKGSRNESEKDSLEEERKPARGAFSVPLTPSQDPPPPPSSKIQRAAERPPELVPEAKRSKVISQEEISELVEEYNLSQVSENLDGVLNESDLHLIEETTSNQSLGNGRSHIQEIREKQAEKKARQSIVEKFFKKESVPAAQLIPAVQSVPAAQLIPAVQSVPAAQLIPAAQPSPIGSSRAEQPPPPPGEAIANSLNFTESLLSRNRSREEIQFTLNPQDRFSSLRPQQQSPEK